MNAIRSIQESWCAWLVALIVAGGCALVVACGGGGGGGGGGADDRIAINALNAEQVASKTATVPMGVASLGSFPEEILTAAVGHAREASLARYVLDQVRQVTRTLADSSRVTVSATDMEIIPCATGQMVVTVVDADEDGTLSVGDSVSVVMEDCQDEDLGGVTNGSIAIEIDAFSGDIETLTPPYSLGLTARFLDFATTETGDGEPTSLTINGEMAITAGSEDGVHFTSSVHGDSLEAAETGPGADSRALRNYAFALAGNTEAGEYTLDGYGDLRTDELGGSVHFEITTPYVELETENFPRTGMMTVTGSGGSRLTITVLDSAQVRLATDEDGDGTTDATVTVSWQTLDE